MVWVALGDGQLRVIDLTMNYASDHRIYENVFKNASSVPDLNLTDVF